MAGRRRLERKKEDQRPVVANDFIYDDPDASGMNGPDQAFESDTPEEAVRKLKRRRNLNSPDDSEPAPDPGTSPDSGESSGPAPKVYSSGIMLDENLMPVENSGGKKERKAHPVLRGIILVGVTLLLILAAAAHVASQVDDNFKALGISDRAISSVVSPVQDFFSGITETFFGYFRSMKLRANIEQAYNDLRAENEKLYYKSMQADELRDKLVMYEAINDEILANWNLEPLFCRITGKADGNYFSTFTIDKGTVDGIGETMAVVYDGWLVGYTEQVEEHKCVVRTIIDSEASIHAVIRNSRRDQGTVRGTLGSDLVSEDGPMLKMFYLPNSSLPRPQDIVVTSGVGISFPEGIPIGEVVESTRRMDENKQYVLVKPGADFQHLEMVYVLRHRNEPNPVVVQEGSRTDIEIDPPVDTFEPPDLQVLAVSVSGGDNTATPDPFLSLSPTPSPTEIATPAPSPSPTPVPRPTNPSYTFQVVSNKNEPTPSPTPTLQPTSTPYFTPDPDDMTFEEE